MLGCMPVEFLERLIAGPAGFSRRLSPSFTPHVTDGPTSHRIRNNDIEIDG
jgi:hypothetical protein